MNTIFRILFILITLQISTTSFAQIKYDNLVSNMQTDEMLDLKIAATQFDDGSYVLSFVHGLKSTKIVLLDQNGEVTKTKDLSKTDTWSFSDVPTKRVNDGMNMPIIDKKSKVCYNLHATLTNFEVTVVDANLNATKYNLKSKILSKKISIQTNMFETSSPIMRFDQDGNPIWVYTLSLGGVLYVKFDIKSKTILPKIIEFKDADRTNSDILGFMDSKIWFGQVLDNRSKSSKYVVNIFSIDNNFATKKEHELSFNKSDKDWVSGIRIADCQGIINDEKIYFSIGTQPRANGIYATSMRFFSYDGKEFKNAIWNSKDENRIANTSMRAAINADGTIRFANREHASLGAYNGVVYTFDADLDNSKITEVKIVKGLPYSADVNIFNFLLFAKQYDESTSNVVNEILESGNVPLVFKGMGDGFFVLKGEYSKTSVTVDLME